MAPTSAAMVLALLLVASPPALRAIRERDLAKHLNLTRSGGGAGGAFAEKKAEKAARVEAAKARASMEEGAPALGSDTIRGLATASATEKFEQVKNSELGQKMQDGLEEFKNSETGQKMQDGLASATEKFEQFKNSELGQKTQNSLDTATAFASEKLGEVQSFLSGRSTQDIFEKGEEELTGSNMQDVLQKAKASAMKNVEEFRNSDICRNMQDSLEKAKASATVKLDEFKRSESGQKTQGGLENAKTLATEKLEQFQNFVSGRSTQDIFEKGEEELNAGSNMQDILQKVQASAMESLNRFRNSEIGQNMQDSLEKAMKSATEKSDEFKNSEFGQKAQDGLEKAKASAKGRLAKLNSNA